MIHRRKLLKQFVFVGAGIAIIPSCLSDKSKSSILLKKINVSGDDEQMLAELCESILPKTTTPGAKDISAHLFVLKMVDDCMSKEDQDTFIGGLTAFNDFSKTITGKYFRDCHSAERAIVLKQLIAIKDDTTN
ncbi:MAG: gluconate 2-dehydrogenase subunit 3 family protein, partial [Sediminibacterium sp.]|nr:gluconate 2-dehydrogenase subunit 3 family protein [Sediminibacterium sp.]